MNVLINRRLTTLAVSAALVFISGCATTHGSLSSSADRLERNAAVLARNASSSSSYSRDARELADEARDFRRIATDRRADDRDVKDAFERVSRDYHAVRDGVDRSNNTEAARELRPVTDAYLDIERAVGGYPADRYARERDRDQRDRY
jgi:hypothetical protein